MKLLVDTTYFLPAIGVSVRGVPRNAVVELIRRGFEVLISEISLFELSAKGAKFVASGMLTPARVATGIRAIVWDDRVRKIPIYDTPILLTAFRLRKILGDFIDCLIISTAMNYADTLVTEDIAIHELAAKEEFRKIVREVNPKFEIRNLKNLI